MAKAKDVMKFILHFFRSLAKMQIPAFSAYAAFFFILAVFPTVMLLMYLIRLTPLSESELMNFVYGISPAVLRPLLMLVSGEVYANLSGAFIGVTGFTLIRSSSRCMVGLINGLNSVYRVKESRSYFFKRFVAFFYMILFIAVLLLLLLFHIFLNSAATMLKSNFDFSISLPPDALRYPITFLALTGLFMAVFKVFPNRKAKFRLQIPGAVITTAGWMIFTRLFTMYVGSFSNYSYLYGSLTVVVAAMLWMYFSVMILFVGGAVNAYGEARSVSIRRTHP